MSDSQVLLSLSEYTSMARAFIIHNLRKGKLFWADSGNRRLATDEDLLGEVVTAIVKADQKYDPNHSSGACTKTLRFRYAYRAMRTWLRKEAARERRMCRMSDMDWGDSLFVQREQCAPKRLYSAEEFDCLINLLEKASLSSRQATVIKMRILDNECWNTIGAAMQITRQGAQQNYVSAIRKLRDAA